MLLIIILLLYYIHMLLWYHLCCCCTTCAVVVLHMLVVVSPYHCGGCSRKCMKMLQNLHILLTFDKVHNPLRLPREATSEPPKVVRTPRALNILTSKCALRHNGVHFFDI